MKNDRVFYTGNGGAIRFSPYRPSANKCVSHSLSLSLSLTRVFFIIPPALSHVNVLFILDFPRTNVFTRSITAAAAGYEGRLLPVSYLVVNAQSVSPATVLYCHNFRTRILGSLYLYVYTAHIRNADFCYNYLPNLFYAIHIDFIHILWCSRYLVYYQYQ